MAALSSIVQKLSSPQKRSFGFDRLPHHFFRSDKKDESTATEREREVCISKDDDVYDDGSITTSRRALWEENIFKKKLEMKRIESAVERFL